MVVVNGIFMVYALLFLSFLMKGDSRISWEWQSDLAIEHTSEENCSTSAHRNFSLRLKEKKFHNADNNLIER